MPAELTIIAVTALLAGLLLVGVMLAGRSPSVPARDAASDIRDLSTAAGSTRRDEPAGTVDGTLRVVWWLTITIVLLGVGISGSYVTDQAPIFLLGGGAVVAVVLFHELLRGRLRGSIVRAAELVTATALIGGLLVLTGFASSPFAMLFALVTVAAALAHGPRAGILAAVLATVAFGAVLATDPAVAGYGPDDALRLSFGLGATWLLAFVAIAYADHQRRVMQRAIDLSRTDALTGLFNRSQLFVTLEQEVSRTRRSDRGFCVLMIDVDGLKAVNDTGGHLRGDQVLRAIGTVIARSTRAVDSAYRYGGDEFVVLLPETDIVGAFVVAEKIRLGAEELEVTMAAGAEPQVSVSIGLVSHPEDGLTAEELMAAADRAMYQAKSLGKNQISGNPRPRPALLSRRSTLEEPPAGPPPGATAPPRRAADPANDGGAQAAPAATATEDPPAATATEDPPAAAESTPATPSPGARHESAIGPRDDRAIAVELGPMVEPASVVEPRPVVELGPVALPEPELEPEPEPIDEPDREATATGTDDSEPDALEVRRRIAAARRSFDPDDHIRRAMDAFFSPSALPGDHDQPPPREH